MHEILPDEIAHKLEPSLRQALETGQPVLDQNFDGLSPALSAQLRHWLVSCHPVIAPQGIILGISCVVQDVTDQRHAEEARQDYAERLKRSNQELEQFAFIASHDLQEPLRKVKMFGNRLLVQMKEASPDGIPADALDSLQRMQNAAERMQKMVDGLLELSRIHTRGGTFEPTELRPVVEDVLNDLEARIQATGGQVLVGNLYSAEVDCDQIRRLFQNLIGNALKFHRLGVPPLIEVNGSITRAREASTITISIKDNGIGFDEQYAARIFQPFQRLHGKDEYEGTGLGLSICQRIVERHHGKIEAHSRPGEGSVFEICLPIYQPVN